MKLGKEERICSRMLIEKLFKGENARSLMSFPLRAVFMTEPRTEDGNVPFVRILVSVPKRNFKHAVDRNRIKRQVREAYRKNKAVLTNFLAKKNEKSVAVAFVWTDSKHRRSAEIDHRVRGLLLRIAEKIQEKP